MCRLLAVKNFNYGRHGEILEDFFMLAKEGKLLPGDPPGHTDGWGLAYYHKGRAAVRKSGASLLKEKKMFFDTLRNIGRTKILIVHLRKSAWKKTSVKKHAHPFAFDNIVFAHNGTVYDYAPLLDFIAPETRPAAGALDTEVLFRFIVGMRSKDLKSALKKTARHIHARHRYSALNVVLSDGKKLYAYRDYTKNPDYYSLYATRLKNSTFICSEPLSSAPRWRPMKNRELIAL